MADIRVQGLRKAYGKVVAVDDITFDFPDAAVTCLLGPSGCGKTTLMRIIAGLEQPTAGEVSFGGHRVTHLAPSKRNIGMVFQYPVVYRGISVYQNIELPLRSEKLSPQERRQRVETVVELLGLQESVHKDITQLDNGTRQKVAVARAVARQPQIILFDEPITNVDANAKLQLKRAFKELTRRLSQTIIYVTHDQTEAMTLADQIALMQDGRIVQCAPPRTLYNQPADVFGGWFLGNPGMDFFPGTLEARDGGVALTSPLFPGPVAVAGAEPGPVTFGIRPEHIVVQPERSAASVRGDILRSSLTVGGQRLLTLRVADTTFKAKVAPGAEVEHGGGAWIALPLAQITLFAENGRRLEAALAPAGATGLVGAAGKSAGQPRT